MNSHRLAVLLAVPVISFAAPALADVDGCATDADCGGYGLVCLEFTDEECFTGSAHQEPECYDVTVHACGPKECASDAECTGGTSCVTFSRVDCDEGCDPDDPDCEGDEEPCETDAESYCVPPFLAPCAVDADCGPDFACVEELECWGEASSSGEYEEVCEPTGESRCEFQPVECASDEDCASGSTCEPIETYAGCDEEDCEGATEAVCMTPAVLAWSNATGGSRGDDDGVAGGAEFGGGESSSSSGCSAAGSSAISLLALLGVALVLRRR